MGRARWERWASLAGAPAAFVALGCLWIDLPGPHPDETIFAHALFPGQPGGPAWSLEIGGRRAPVMLMPYLGALKAWLYAPVVAMFGTGPWALRLPAVLAGAAALALLFLLAERWFDRRTAHLAVWLTAADATYLWTARCDWGPVALQRLLGLGGCGLVYWWARRGGGWRLFLGFFAFGLGLFDKLSFHWLLAGYAAAVVLVFPAEARRLIRPAAGAAAAAGLAAGAAPYLAYRLLAPASALDLAWATAPAAYWRKLGMLIGALDGTAVGGFLFAGEGTAVSLLPWALALALPYALWRGSHAARFAAVVWLAALAAMAPVRDAGAVHHVALTLPFPQLLVAAALARLDRRRLALAIAAVLLAANAAVLADSFVRARRDGGSPLWTEAAYPLAGALRERRPRLAISLDWGVEGPQRFLLAHDPPVQPMAFPWDWADRGTVERIEQELTAGDVVFVRRADPAQRLYPETGDRAREAAERAGRRLELAERIRDRQGRAVFEVFETPPAP